MPGQAKPLHLRLFLEGVEVPVVSAAISINVNSPAAASIQIVPIDEGMDFKPRTMVHLFFLDQYDVLPSISQIKDDKRDINFLKNYKLLYCGEIVGFVSSQNPTSRSLVLQCLDFSSYWDAAVAESIDYGPSGNAFTHNAAFYGADANLFDDIVNHQGERMMGWLRSTPLTPGLQTVSGLAGGVIRMLEAMGGVPNHHKGVNDFFTVAQLRCKILEQIVAEEHDNTAANLLSIKVFDQWLLNGLQNQGPEVTFRDMLKKMFDYVYYEVVPNPVAKFDPDVNVGPVQAKKTIVELAQNPKAIKAAADLHQILDSCSQHAGTTVNNPTANKNVAKALISEMTETESLIRPLGSAFKDIISNIDKAKSTLQRGLSSTNPIDLDKAFEDATGSISEAIDVLETSDAGTISGTQFKTGSQTARLRSQIIRPDCFFSAPPVCNVIFPEQYSQLSYERVFIQEVTRNQIRLFNNLYNSQKDANIAETIIAPNIGTDIKFVTKQEATAGIRALMPHELHTGIIGRTEWMANNVVSARAGIDSDTAKTQRGARLKWSSRAALFHFFKFRFASRQASVSGRFNPYLVCGFPSVIIRRPFIPDPDVEAATSLKDLSSDDILEQVQNNADLLGGPSQLVGMIGSLQHSIDQNGGTTSASLHHVRVHNGIDDEFIGVFSAVSTRKKIIRVIVNAKQAVADNVQNQLNVLIGVTPQASNGPKSKVSKKSKGKTQVSVSSSSATGGTSTTQQTIEFGTETAIDFNSDSPIATSGRIEALDRDKVLIPNPTGSLTVGGKGIFGTIKGVEVLPPFTTVKINGKTAFTNIALYEEVTIDGDFPVPIEEIIRPAWFSDAYSNDNIGQKIYQHFFGCASIVDQVKFGIPGNTTIPTTVPGSNDITDMSPDQRLQDVFRALENKDQLKGFATIEKAINLIGYFYGLVKSKNLDVERFIEAYSNRPVATIIDILGSPDLQYSIDSSGKASVSAGKPGFHSAALNPLLIEKGNLSGLVDDPTLQLPRINNEGKKESIPPQYDVRKAKRDRVLKYVQVLLRGRGLKG